MSEVAVNAELGKGVNFNDPSDLCTRIEDEFKASTEPSSFLGRRRQRKRQSHSIIQNSENDDFDSDSLSPPNVSMFSSDSVPFETKTSDLCNEDDEERPTKLANLKENPEIHSFRVVNAEASEVDQDSDLVKETGRKDSDLTDTTTASCKNSGGGSEFGEHNKGASADGTGKAAAQKYVLMCFICKLSFGETKSFFQHAKFEHKICDLKWKKEFANVDLENTPNLSAIIQKDSNDSPSVCFLEPMSTNYNNYETLLKGKMGDLPVASSLLGDHHNTSTASAEEGHQTPVKMDVVPDLSAFFKEEALKQHRKLSESLLSPSDASADEKAAAAANVFAGNSNLNAYLFELCRQIYGGGLPPLLGNQNNNSSSKTEPHSNNHPAAVDDKQYTPNSSRRSPDMELLSPEVKIKEERLELDLKRDTMTPIAAADLNKSPISIKTDRGENGYSLDDDRDASDSMSANILAMYQSMAAKRGGAQPQQQQPNIPKEVDAMSTLFCPEHKFAGNGQIAPDCKNCAIVNLIKSSMKSPPPQQNSATKVSPNSSFTIGMCPDHLNGRPLGVECIRCEMILNSSRMSGHSAVTSSTRNSCKTLKCPQCNWHYKYQETLEIHMREKHPDGESACAFCLAGQQHPRLARGESYTCGYKPYRCEICNYSTTTKGNLSIHMQSDKHLNNMQELSNQQQQQQMVDVEPPPPLSKTPHKSPPHSMSSSVAGDLPGLGQSAIMGKMGACNTMKPNFRCDVCSYETAVARNLRIHMTSEKHIQNMTALQQNIKQYQFMKQAPPANIMQQLQNCLPEQAIADYSYNQALLIKLLQHQNQMGEGMSTPQSESLPDESMSGAMEEEDNAKSEGGSGGNTSMDNEMAASSEGSGRPTDNNNNAENKDLTGNSRKTPESQSWYENDETRGSDCSSNDQYSSADRYTDPQRPYKCDVCQESFTQKSILLVHFNSVSHINRIKKQLPGKASDEASNNLKRKLAEPEQESSKKRFKCDICKVAYAQGSTLDIHMRSVLHQTRTCRMNQEQQMRAMQNSSEPKESRSNPQSAVAQDSPTHIYKTLLENFGFDIVKQFNEIDSKLGPQGALNQMYKAGLLSEEMSSNNKPLSLVPEKNLLRNEPAQETNEAMDCSTEKQYFCRHCSKCFSSIFVLKSHYEEVHNESIPVGVLENFAESLKKSYYKGSAFPDEVIDFSTSKPKEEREPRASDMMISPKRSMRPATPETPMIPPGPSFEEQQLLQKHLQTMNMLSLMNQNRVNGEDLQQQQQQQQQGLPGNSFDLLNLLQFHQHLLSLNFMNLAPPLMINNNVQANVNTMSRAPHRPESVMEEPILPPSYGNAFMAQNNIPPTNQKRARTRITDEQLKILRSHFDINNSPSEESIMEMSKKANLPMKVVKHWFRNTLFKERQKNKDSPYNFNNPPSTTLNLEEYERTGQAKATPPNSSKDLDQSALVAAQLEKQELANRIAAAAAAEEKSLHGHHSQSGHQDNESFSNVDEKSQQSSKSFYNPTMNDQEMDAGSNNIFAVAAALNVALKSSQQQQQQNRNKSELSAMSPGTNVSSMCNVDAKSECESINSGCSDLINSTNTNGSSQPQSPNDFWSQTPSPIFQQNAAMDMVSGKKFKDRMPDMNAGPSSNGNNSMNGSSSMGSSTGKRANRTRFTDYQIKVLQEFFENNSYPKDSDLEYLSKLLLLSPRVIVVWFQNARQKQRKIYENQPNNMPNMGISSSSTGGSSPTPTPTGHGISPMDSPTSSVYSNEGDDKTKHLSGGSNISYTCKKCSSVFQRYYELIRHQKNHCFKEENNKKSAKAQIAAAQIAQQCLTTNAVAMPGASPCDLDMSKSPKSVFPGGAPSQQHLAAIMAAAAMAMTNENNKGEFGAAGNMDAVDLAQKEEHMDMVRNLTAILGSVANNQNNDCPPLHLPGMSTKGGAPEQYNLPPELKDSVVVAHEPSSCSSEGGNHNKPTAAAAAADHMCNKSLEDTYSNASESTDKGSAEARDDALIQNPSTQQPCPSAGLLFIDDSHLDTSNQHLPTIKLQKDAGQACNPPPGRPLGPASTTANKRLRTTITPEQLHFLYECYQNESNPSRKMLEQIAKQVNLKKRVVQVWYQNSRARERKGQYRTSSSIMSGNLMMDAYGNANPAPASTVHAGGGGALNLPAVTDSVDSLLKSPKLGDASDLGYLFGSFKQQHY